MPSEAFPVVKAQVLPMPGSCAKCGSSQRDCIDLLIDHDYYGAVLLCVLCARELVHVEQLGFMFKEEATMLIAQNSVLSDRDTTLSNARNDLRVRLNNVLDNFDTVVDTVDNPELPGLLGPDNSDQDLLQDTERANRFIKARD